MCFLDDCNIVDDELLFSSIAFFEVASVRTKCGALMSNHVSTQIRMGNRSSLILLL